MSRRLIIVAHDAAVTALALVASFLLRWGSAEFGNRLEPILLACALTLPVAIVSYWAFRLDRAPWKFVSLSDLNAIALAVTVPALFLVLLDFLSRGALIVPRTVPVIYWLLQCFLLTGPRIAYRIYRSRRQERRAFRGRYRVPVLVVGTGEEADGLTRRLRRDAVNSLDPVGLLTTKPRQVGDRIQQVPIIGLFGELERVMATLADRQVRPRRLVLTREALHAPEIDALLGTARRLGLAAVRPSQELTDVDPTGAPVSLAPVSIDDLLGRSARDLDLSPARQLIAGRRVAVTGAGGSIGSELCRQAAAFGAASILLFEQSELALWGIGKELTGRHPGPEVVPHLGDVRDRRDLETAFSAFRPELVFHAAALKHVDIAEAHPVVAARTNTLGTAEVAAVALAHDVICAVFISTDKAVEPVSVLGLTKRAGERIWAAWDARARDEARRTRFVTVRFGNVLGSSGSVIPLFAEQLRQGGPITVTHPDVERYFMTISEAVRLVLMATSLGVAARETAPAFVLDMGEPVRIVDLAERMVRLAGLEPGVDIEIAFSGLRPGEKLTEVLESSGDELLTTAVPGLRASVSYPSRGTDPEIELPALTEAAAAFDGEAVISTLARIVPEYRRS